MGQRKTPREPAPTRADVELLTPEQVSELLNVDTNTLTAWRSRHEGPSYVKLGRLVRYHLKDLHAWLKLARVEHQPRG